MLDDLLNQLLAKLELADEAAHEAFLRPVYARDIHDPFLLTGIRASVARILAGMEKGEKIIIFADYDADGVPGAAILTEFFRRAGYADFEVYIPDRQTESHGLSLKFIEQAAKSGASLVITIDCGSSNVAEAERARELGLDLIITDHHLTPAVLPPAFALINPKQPGDQYPEKMLSGAGVAFKLVQALNASRQLEKNLAWEKSLLDLVAIATIADRVPLRGENRAFAKFGLLMLKQTRRPGLIALMRAARLKPFYVTEDDIGFTIGPRINAAGRMAHAHEAYQLLTASDHRRAEALAFKLENQNAGRKILVEGILKTAHERLAGEEPPPLIVLGDEAWPPAVLGLAASRLGERYGRSVFLYGRNEAGDWKGSCRSVGGLNVVELMLAAAAGEPLFSDLGGHAAAGGFSLHLGAEAILAERLLLAFQTSPAVAPAAELIPDLELGVEDVTPALWQALEQLAPFGPGNPKPLFRFTGAKLAKVKTFGATNNHLELSFKQASGGALKAIAFFTTYPHLELKAGQIVDLLATLEKSYFKTEPELRLRIVDLKLA